MHHQNEKIKVAIRLRPFTEEEKSIDHTTSISSYNTKSNSIIIQKKNVDDKYFKFDKIFSQNSSQSDVFDYCAKDVIDGVLNGYNGTIFAYGQTGAGKTFTMMGNENNKGIIPNTFHYLFSQINSTSSKSEFRIYVAYIQIYLEAINDLLNPDFKDIRLREDPDNGVFVEGVEWIKVKSCSDCESILRYGDKNRVTQSTKMNLSSSRSHAIFIIRLERKQSQPDQGSEKKLTRSTLYLVDLAGSERIKKTNPGALRLAEAKKINFSLLVLGNCIQSLTDGKSSHISYRDSKLTRLLQDSLGGNAKTSLIVTISPSTYNTDETISSLNFALRAMKVQNKPRINQVVDYYAIAIKLQSDLDKLNDQYSRLKLAYETLLEENEKFKNGENLVELQRQKITSNFVVPNNTVNSSFNGSLNESQIPSSTFDFELKTLDSFYQNLLNTKAKEYQNILNEVDKILLDKESEVEELKKENETLRNKFSNQSDCVRDLQNQNDDLIKTIDELTIKLEIMKVDGKQAAGPAQSGGVVSRNANQNSGKETVTFGHASDDVENIKTKISELESQNEKLTVTNKEIVSSFLNKVNKEIHSLLQRKDENVKERDNITISLSKNEFKFRLNKDEIIKIRKESSNSLSASIENENGTAQIEKIRKKNSKIHSENEKMLDKRDLLNEQIATDERILAALADLRNKFQDILDEEENHFSNEKTYYACECLKLMNDIEIQKIRSEAEDSKALSLAEESGLRKSPRTERTNKRKQSYVNTVEEDSFSIMSANSFNLFNEKELLTIREATIKKYEMIISNLEKENKDKDSKISFLKGDNEKYLVENKSLLSSNSNFTTMLSILNDECVRYKNAYKDIELLNNKKDIEKINPSNFFNFENKIIPEELEATSELFSSLMKIIYDTSSTKIEIATTQANLEKKESSLKTKMIRALHQLLSFISKFDIDSMGKMQSKIFQLNSTTPIEEVASVSTEVHRTLINKYVNEITTLSSRQASKTSETEDSKRSSEKESEIQGLKQTIEKYENEIHMLKLNLSDRNRTVELSTKINFIFGYIFLLTLITIMIYYA